MKASVPIACADVVITRNRLGSETEVALISRRYRDGSLRWCHLGGRVGIDESLRESAIRHLTSTLIVAGDARERLESLFPRECRAPFEFFRVERPGELSGVDPDKHAVSWVYHLEWPWSDGPEVVAGGEALSVAWFKVSRLPEAVWPGTAFLIQRTLAVNFMSETYAAVSAQSDTHNTLLWQTPVLAMTAQAFLLTIGLGNGIAPLARFAAAGLSVVVSLLSIQLMLKHAAMQRRDSILLEEIERRRGMLVYHVKPLFERNSASSWLAAQESHVWWLVGMSAFGLVSLTIAVAALR